MTLAELWTSTLWPLIVIVAQSLLLLVVLLISIAYVLLADRKIWAAVQIRRGPNVVGPWGLLQSFADLLKFVFKEPTIPAGANKGVFLLAPLVTCTLALAAWAVIPVNAGWVIAEINVGVLYIFAISSLMVYGIIMAGWASNSKYAFLAAIRRADGVLRGLDRLRDHHRAAVRRLVEALGDRRCARARSIRPPMARVPELVLAVAAANVRGVFRLGAGRN
jgi:NADH:ubiquinone oxidoreductase subunit H